MGSQLVEIRSATENKFVVNIGLGTFTDKPSQHLEHVNRWIGLSDSKKEGTWVWQGSNAVAAYTNWARNEPNNYGPGGWGANCALIWKNHDGEWDDQNCDRKNHFVCQKSEDRLMLGSSFVQCVPFCFFLPGFIRGQMPQKVLVHVTFHQNLLRIASQHTWPCCPIKRRRRSGQSVAASDFGSHGPRFESGRGRCVESLDKALYSHCPKEKPSH